MKSTGIFRNVDELGRIVIPKEIRDKLDIKIKDEMEIYVSGANIILKKYETNCFICGSKKNLTTIKERVICKECLDYISSLKNENA